MRIGGFTLGMGLEDVIYQCKTEASHEFIIELQIIIAHSSLKSAEVFKDMRCLFFRQRNNRVLIEGDTATDAVIV